MQVSPAVKTLWTTPWVLPLLLALAGMATTGLAVQRMRAEAAAEQQQRFEHQAERLGAELRQRLQLATHGLRSLRATFSSTIQVDRDMFRRWVQARRLTSELPGVTQLGYAQRAGAVGRGVRQVVTLIEPAGMAWPAPGDDLAARAEVSAAIAEALLRDDATLSGRVGFGGGRHDGLLFLMPVFQHPPGGDGLLKRMDALAGLAFAAVDLDAMLGALASEDELGFDLYDGDPSVPANRLFAGAGTGADMGDTRDARQLTLTLDTAGRPLSLRVFARPAFEQAARPVPLLAVAASGIALSLLAALCAWLLLAGRARAERLARRMTTDLDRLATIVRRTSNAVIMTDAALAITWVNEGFTRLYGYSLEEAIGCRPGDLLGSGLSPASAIENIARGAREGSEVSEEVLNRTRDGSLRWVHVDIQPLRDSEGRLQGFVEIGTDLSAARQAAEDLATERERLAAIIEGTNVGTWEWNVASGEVVLDERSAAIIGHSVAELSPVTIQTWEEHCHPADREHVGAQMLAHLRGHSEGYECEFRMRHKDGHWVWFQSRARVSRRSLEGRALWVAGTHMDITGRKQLEMQLADEERFVREITDHLPVRVAYFDLEGRYRFVNQAVCDRLGLPREQIIGRSLAELTGAEPDPTLLPHIERVRGGQAARWEAAELLQDRVRRVATTLIPAVAADGRVRGAYSTAVDVTELRQSEQDLRRAYERMQSIVENMPCAISVFDSDLMLVLHNTRFRSLLNFPDELFAGPRTSFESIIRFNAERGEYGDVDIESAVAATVKRSRHASHHQFERTRPDGSVLEVRGAPMPGGGFVTTYVDVSQRKRLEAEQQRVAAMLRAVMEALPCGLTVHDAANRIVLHNDKWAQIYGLPPEFLAATPINVDKVAGLMWRRGEYGPMTEAAALEAAYERTRQAGQAPHFWLRQRPGGVFLEVRSAPAPGGGFVSTYTDVTEQRRIEAEREKARAILLGAIDAVDEAFVLYDAEDRLVLCNDKYRALNAPVADLLVPGALFDSILRAGAERGQYQAALGRVDDWVAEVKAIRGDGNATVVQQMDNGSWLRIVERRMANGHVVGFRIDITDLMTARQAAEQASRMKSQFLANMSHEIRTPMNAILGMLSLLQRTEQTPRQQEYARKTEGAAKSLLALLNDILDFSKVEAGKMSLDPQPLRVDQMLRDLSMILAASAGPKPVELLFDIDPALPRQLVGDELRLRQVLVNLAGNALKFTARGEVVLTVRVLGGGAAGAAAADVAEVEVEFSVSDTGIGIAPENQARIFAGFSQAEASTTRRFGGTGLGLAISQRLIAMMGGELQLESELGQGSRFHFRLTLPVPAQALPGPAPEARQGLHALRTLIVDDNPRSLALLGNMARALGWAVDTIDRGEQALALAATAQAEGRAYQAVFMAWNLPGLDGAQTARRLRSSDTSDAGSDSSDGGAQAQRPVLILMGSAHARELQSRRDGEEPPVADGFLTKPVTASMLHDAVADAFAARQPAAPRQRSAEGGTRPLAGLRLLLVEDNPNNQQVARELLEDEGALIAIANNGQEGVDAVAAAQPDFDAVLMDIQMPVMDGYTATAHIRQSLGRTALPIVAMTANAMASDRADCLAAGMNDHVGKPFDLARLIAVLLRLTGRDAAANPAAPAPAKLPAEADAVAARHGIDLRGALARYMGKLAVYTRLLQNFERTLFQLPDELAAAAAQGDRVAAARSAHTLKGLAATLGIDRLAQAAAEAEQRLHATDAEQAEACAAAVTAAARAAAPGIAELAACLAGFAGPAARKVGEPAAPFDPANLRQRIARLADLIDSSDMAALDGVTQLRQQFETGPSGPLHAALAALDDAVTALDFEHAARLCQTALTLLADMPATELAR